jgi:diguanylate cyclase (GGDEF)-like protein
MTLAYCEKFGFTEAKLRERLQWLELDSDDLSLGTRLQEVIRPNLPAIINPFYDWLQTLDEARLLLGDAGSIENLRHSQSAYLLSLGVDFDQLDYFESRLRVGQAHVWVGLSLSLYQCAYRRLTYLILQHIPDTDRELIDFVHKITMLDMSLAIETYHLAQVQTLEETLERSQVQQNQLMVAASTDSLTGLANHRSIMNMLTKSLSLAKPNQPVAAVMVDIDHFKQINDEHGHIVGDKVLMDIAHRLKAGLRDFDRLGRYGGEEFLLVLNGAKLGTARKVAERVRQHVAAGPVNLQGLEVEVTISLGIAVGNKDEEAERLVARADAALYAAKAAGRNCVMVSE